MREASILLVEDNPDHVLITKRGLRNNAVVNELQVLNDGQQALDYLHRRGEFQDAQLPDLILLDIKLPKVDGLQVLQHVKADPELRRIPVIMLTTSARDEEIARSYLWGANSYITKPIQFTEFTEKIRQMKFYWLLVNELPPR